jgi:[NiFe] hydrogenase assembly HybE family chaperone
VNAAPSAVVAACRRIEDSYRQIQATRMGDLGLCHPQLRVEALGFEPDPAEPQIAIGVLVTPWSMNLLRIALDAAAEAALAQVGRKRLRGVGGHSVEFLGSHEAAIGRFEACSLFSPMSGFADHDTALATAREVLRLLRAPATAASSAPGVAAPQAVSDRRRFLFGARGPATAAQPPARP